MAMAMAALHPTTPVEVLPLHTTTTTSENDNNNLQQRLIVHDASSLRGSSSLSNGSVNDGGDVIAFIQHHQDTNNRQVVVQRMDGTNIASFSLPADTNNDNAAASSRQKQRNNGNNNKNELSEWSDGYQTQVLCWASFHKQQQQDGDTKNISIGGGRKMLCVLGNQNTLLVFDVLGDTAILATTGNHTTNTTLSNNNNNKSNGDDDDDAGGGPGGHTISLPFRAQSIYPVPNGCGLIIVRTPSEEDYVAAVQEEEEEASSQSLVSDGGGGGVDAAMPPPPPPSALGMSLPATPRRQYIEGKTNNEDDDELSLEIGPPDPLRFGVNNNNNNIQNNGAAVVGLLPCLFTLRHPLDEIRPVATTTTTAVASSQMDDEEEEGVGMGVINNSMTDSPLRDGITTDMTEDNDTDQEQEEQQQLKLDLFTDVNETLVHVGSPRLFHHPSYSSSESSNNSCGGSSAATLPPMICVTYNEALKRHTI
eukprot:scaffold1781_cov76-Skeletonema_dohrnii-CCMP3373.AAC.1